MNINIVQLDGSGMFVYRTVERKIYKRNIGRLKP